MRTPHEQLKQNLAAALADETALVAYVRETFGKTPLIIVNRYGAQGFPGEEEAPFIWIFSEDAENEAGDVDEEAFTVGVVFGAVDGGPCARKVVSRRRTDEAAGIETYGVMAEVEAVREMIFDVVRRSTHGAIFRSATRTEANLLDYPLEWAKLRIDYAEPDTLDD